MATNFLSTRDTKDTKFLKKIFVNFVYFVDSQLRGSWWMLVVCLALVVGCKSEPSSQTSQQKQSDNRPQLLRATDPCPERLHNLAGAILNFMLQYDRLPPTLEDLTPIKGTPLELTCPASGQKYVYLPNGVKIPPNRWAIVYDATPAHNGKRWMIVFSPVKEGQAPVPAVISISEQEFKAATELPTFSN